MAISCKEFELLRIRARIGTLSAYVEFPEPKKNIKFLRFS